MREQEESDGFSNWKVIHPRVSKVHSHLNDRHREEWIMDANVYDADAMLARTLKNVGMSIDIQRRVLGKPNASDAVSIFGKDKAARETFWKIAQMSEITDLSTAPVHKRYRRSKQLEIVTGAVNRALRR